jgi:hypothetical protein
MTPSLGRFFFACDDYRLASVVIWMTVTPIPIRGLLSRFRFSKGTIFLVFIPAILTVGTVLVGIPVVIVLVATVIDPVLVFVVSMVFLLASIVLRLCRANCCWGGKDCGKNKRTQKISISTVHLVFLLAQDFLSEFLARNEYAGIASEKMSDTAHCSKGIKSRSNLEATAERT